MTVGGGDRPRRGGRPADPQLAGRVLDRLDEGLGGRGGRFGLGRAAGDDVEPERRVEHRAADAAFDHHPPPAFELRRQRDAAAGRLQAEEAAAGGGDADRAGAVAGRGDRHQAGGDRRGRAAARAARRALRVPRVAGDAVGGRLGEAADRQLRQQRQADDDRPRLAQPADHLGVGLGGHLEGVGAVQVDLAGDVDFVLDRDRHAEQRPLVARRSAAPRPARLPASPCRRRPCGRRSARDRADRSVRACCRPARSG